MSDVVEAQAVPVIAAPAVEAPVLAPPMPIPNFKPRPSRPLLGGALWIFGALFWAYLVMGELVVTLELSEVIGFVAVLVAVGLAWQGAVEGAPAGKLAPKIVPGVAGVLLFLFTLFFFTALFGSGSRSAIAGLTVAFFFPAVGGYIIGRRLTGPKGPPLTGKRRVARIALWVVSLVATAITVLSAGSRM